MASRKRRKTSEHPSEIQVSPNDGPPACTRAAEARQAPGILPGRLPGPLDMDATQLTAAYRTGLHRPSTVIRACIDLVTAAQGALNFLVENRFEAALAEAALSDARYRSGQPLGPLDGVPMTVKESFDVAGMHTTGGLPARKDHVAETDAAAVARMRNAGAIVLGKTNTPPLCLSMETDNLLYGRTNNPWNPLCTPGGSSGGEAVAVAIGASAFGIGSDMGGSVRLPAAFCGVVGYKPAPASFPWEGHFPLPDPAFSVLMRMISFGPLARSVRDARLLAQILHPEGIAIPSRKRIGRLLVAGNFEGFHLHPDIDRILAKATAALADIATTTRFAVPRALPGAARIWQQILSSDGGRTMARLAYGKDTDNGWGHLPSAAADLFRRITGNQPRQHPWIAWAILGSFLFAPSMSEWQKTEKELEAGFASLHEELGEGSVLLSPIWATPAPPHGRVVAALLGPSLSHRTLLPHAVMANVYGLPAITVPCGFSSAGMPVGLQLTTLPGQEAELFAAAAHLETSLGGSVRCRWWDPGHP